MQYTVRHREGDAAWAAIANELKAAPIEFHPAGRRLADVAADLKRRHRISLADAFAAALAKPRKTELVTGDPELKPLEQEIKINWLTLFKSMEGLFLSICPPASSLPTWNV